MLKELSKLARFEFLEKITITFTNPTKVRIGSIFRPSIWQASIHFEKENCVLYKDVQANDTEEFAKKIIQAVEKEETI